MGHADLSLLQCIAAVLALFSFYLLWTRTHLVRKIVAWFFFQTAVLLFWVSSIRPYHGQVNPLALSTVLLLLLVTAGVLAILMAFAWGAFKRYRSFEIDKFEGGLS